MLRIGFTIILNGLHHLKHNNYAEKLIKDLDYWIIVEGASNNNGSTKWCYQMPKKYHKNGASIDGTIEFLTKLSKKHKNIIFVKSNGVWNSKDDMVNRAISEVWKITKECFLWEIDIDEQMTSKQRYISEKELLSKNGKMGKFHVYQYVGRNLIAVGGWVIPFNRLWLWKGEKFQTHEPPVLEGGNGTEIFMSEYINHYSFYFEQDIQFKNNWYGDHKFLLKNWIKLQKESDFPQPITYLFPEWVNGDRSKTKITKMKKIKVDKLIFYNNYHNGDIHYSREFIKDIMSQIEFENCYYLHKNNSRLLMDIENLIQDKPNPICNDFKDITKKDNNLYINTWVGQGKVAFEYLDKTEKACSLHTHYEVYKDIYKQLDLELKEIEYYLPTINYEKFNIKNINEFLSKRKNLKVLICNGKPLSGQSDYFNFNDIVLKLSEDFYDVEFILTDDQNKIENKNNIHYTSDIIKMKDNDLNEISYLSLFCDIIIGRSSGPYAFAQVKENFYDRKKYFIGYAKNEWDTYWYKTDTCNFLTNLNKETSYESIKNVISISNKKVNVYFNYYISKYEKRNDEILYCLNQLTNNKKIDNVYVICSDNLNMNFDRIKKIPFFGNQPTFRYYFNLINENSTNEDINIILNSDCFIKEYDVELITNNIKENEVYCLTRWDIKNLNPFYSIFFNESCSQDAWIFKGKISDTVDCNFMLGVSGCDNAIAHELDKCGYQVLNPSKDIKIYHYHLSNIRTYGTSEEDKNIHRIKRPYKFIVPHNIENITENPIETKPVMENSTSIKDVAINILKNYEYEIYLKDVLIYNSIKNNSQTVVFNDNDFTINNQTYSYRGVKIKKLKINKL